MRRREFITLLGSTAVAWPGAVWAQRGERLRRIGVIMPLPENDPEAQHRLHVIKTGLQGRGWIEGSNIHIDIRWGVGGPPLSTIAKELVGLPADIIIAQSTTAVVAIQRETRTIPVIFIQVVDPVGQGLVASLARPGGNITGFSNFETAIGGKWVELLKEIAPRLTRVAVLFSPSTAPYKKLFLQSVEAAVPSFSVDMTASPVQDHAEIEPVLRSLGGGLDTGLILPPDIFSTNNRKQIGSLAVQYRLPTVAAFPYMAKDGGLLSYGPEVTAMLRQALEYVDRVLKGENTGTLPVQQPTKYELVVNLNTARALGLDVSPTLLARADEVIE
jgi:putative ABC transport system substrate-binding protein